MWVMPKEGRNILLLSPRYNGSEELWQDLIPKWGILPSSGLDLPLTFHFRPGADISELMKSSQAYISFLEMNSTLRRDPGHDSWDSCLLGVQEDCFFFPIQVLPTRERKRTVSGRLGRSCLICSMDTHCSSISTSFLQTNKAEVTVWRRCKSRLHRNLFGKDKPHDQTFLRWLGRTLVATGFQCLSPN